MLDSSRTVTRSTAHELSTHWAGETTCRTVFSDGGWPAIFRADILREWNTLDNACSLAEEAVPLCRQAESLVSIIFLFWGYAVLLRVYLSCGKLDAAYSVLQQFEHVGTYMNQFTYRHMCSIFATGNSIKLWLACGELDRATRWVEELGTKGGLALPLLANAKRWHVPAFT